jgi:hypothetical protein
MNPVIAITKVTMLTTPAEFKPRKPIALLGIWFVEPWPVAVGSAMAMALIGPTEIGDPGPPGDLAAVAPGTGAAA